MQILHEEFLPASPASIFSIYTNPDFYHHRYAEAGIDAYQLEQFEDTEHGFTVAIALEVGLTSKQIPAALARGLGGRQAIRYRLDWRQESEGYVANYLYQLQQMPIRLDGRMYLQPHAQGCLHRAELEVHCGLPLIAGIAKRMIKERVELELNADLAALRSRLYSG